jgi:uncharacterized spore protein YtfJ
MQKTTYQCLRRRYALADIIKTAMDQIQTISKTETVIGEPIQAGMSF